MAVDVAEGKISQANRDDSNNSVIENLPTLCDSEPNLALLDFSDGIWYSDCFTSTCAAIKDRYIRTNNRFKKFTNADILACIKFENTDDDDNKRKQKRNRRVRFSTGMSISVDSLVQCNSDHQTESRENGDHVSGDLTERQFLEAEFLTVPPHRHLTAGENKICNAYFEDKKTVGYGRRCINPYTSYNNPFDPRLRFNGLHNELNIANSVTAFGDRKSIDVFNCALTLVQDPAEFLDTYLNSYRNYLKSLAPQVQVSNGHESEVLEESESSINIQDTSEVDEEENRLLQKLESVRSLWGADCKKDPIITTDSTDANNARLDDIGIKLNVNNPTPVEIDIESISEALSSLHLGQHGDSSPRTSTPKLQHITVKPRSDEKLIVHTTCLSSDGQSTETMIHETILKPSPVIPPVRNDKQEDSRESIRQFVGNEVDISYPIGNLHPDVIDNAGKTSEEFEDDSDGTLTPGEEEIGVNNPPEEETLKKPKVILRRGQTHAAFGYENEKADIKQNRNLVNDKSESREANPELTNAEPKKNTKLRATTEPFIPTSQKIFENPSLVSNGIIGDYGATAKQTTAPTDNGPIYQTSDMFSTPPISVTEDTSRHPPGFWYSYHPPNQQHFPSEQHFQHPNSYVMNRQPESHALQSQQNPLQPPVNSHPVLPPGLQQDMQHVRYQYPDHFKQENLDQQNLHQNHQTCQFDAPVRTQNPNQYPGQQTGRGSHIPVHTTRSRYHHPPGSRNARAKFRNQSRQSSNSSSHWIPQTNSLQGQPSNTQPVYNAFWLQFQNTRNPNIQQSVHVPPRQEGPVPNIIPPVPSSNLQQEHQQQYGFPSHMEPQSPAHKDMFQQPVYQQQHRPNQPVTDNQFIRPENPFGVMNHRASQPSGRPAANGPLASTSGPGSPCFNNPTFAANINNNANNNAYMDDEQDCVESNIITMKEVPEGIDGCNIDVLDNSTSREKYRALKKPGKRLRPLRSCLVQLV